MVTTSKVKWQRVFSVEAAALVAPPLPGVYVIGCVRNISNLPLEVEWVYVGRSANLQRRLSQHNPLAEAHPLLREWIVRGRGRSEVWFTTTDAETAKQLEVHLIRELKPPLNRMKYSGKRG